MEGGGRGGLESPPHPSTCIRPCSVMISQIAYLPVYHCMLSVQQHLSRSRHNHGSGNHRCSRIHLPPCSAPIQAEGVDRCIEPRPQHRTMRIPCHSQDIRHEANARKGSARNLGTRLDHGGHFACRSTDTGPDCRPKLRNSHRSLASQETTTDSAGRAGQE